jgi:hypothetical protein
MDSIINNEMPNFKILNLINKNKNIKKYTKLLNDKFQPAINIEKVSLSFEEQNDIIFEFINTEEKNQISILKNSNYLLAKALKSKFSENEINDILSFFNELIYLITKNNIAKNFSIPLLIELLPVYSFHYDDEIRYKFFSNILYLADEDDLNYKNKNYILKLNRELYETLFNFEFHYDSVKPYTFESELINITRNDALLLTQGEIQNINLKSEIESAIIKLGGSVFFKIRRSPKDAFYTLKKNAECNFDEKNFMKISYINHFLNLCKASQRVHEDVINFSTNENDNDSDIITISFKKWENIIENEFRCFYCKNNLNAVSCSSSLWTEGNIEQIESLFNSDEYLSIFRLIPYDHAVLDVYIETDSLKLKIIEINPFGKVSSAGKFSWVVDRDVLTDGFNINKKVTIKY